MQVRIFNVNIEPLRSVIKIMEKKIEKDNPDGARPYLIMNSRTKAIISIRDTENNLVYVDDSLEDGIIDVR